jgi:hypothetical protein
MKGVYSQYFQKSKVFLYPLLKLKKGIDFVPEQTYIAWDNIYDQSDFKFLCLYSAGEKDLKFNVFHEKHLKNHHLLESYIYLGDDTHIYVFDYSCFKHDFLSFIDGKYSKFSIKTKSTILNFFGNIGNISEYVKSFLNPELYHETYAEALEVDVKLIKEVWELCSLPDKEKETILLKIPEELELFKNNSISLNKL